MILAIVVFIIMLLLLVLVHEWGHFIVAKWADCEVEEFGFGFPPRLFSFMRNGTLFSFNLLPIGGFVKIEGENMDEAAPGPKSFASKSALKRIAILIAGVVMNVVLAAILFSIQAGIGTPTIVTERDAATLQDIQTYIVDVSPNSPAAAAGITALDRVVKINEIAQPSITQIQTAVAKQAGHEVSLEIDRVGKHISLQVIPRVNPPAGEGALGVSLASSGLLKVPWWKAPGVGISRTGQGMVAIVSQFWLFLHQFFASGQVNGNLTGPIGIAVYTNEATQMGLPYILEFAALISLNLAIVNILPFPALDGGRILFVVIEQVIGRRVSGKVESWIHGGGFALLIALMILITLKDIRHYF